MKISNSLRLVLGTGLALGAMSQAFAAGTLAGTDITNTASVDFFVGGVNQTDVNSNTTTFNVDRRINLTVAEVGTAATNSVPGSTDQFLTFTVTNSSNSVQDFRLFATQDAGGATAHGDTDTFDVNAPTTPGAGSPSVFVESGANAGYQPAEDTAIFIDELAPDTTRTVYIVSSIPAAQVNGDTAGLTLTAVAAQSTDAGGNYVATAGTLAPADSAETNTGVADNTTFVDTVFGDNAGDTDAAQDGRHSDDDEYDVVTAAIAVTKSSVVVSDPFNGTTNPKSIPGAVVEYCLDVNNTGAAAAGTIILTDAIPANTLFVAGSIKSASTGALATCDLDSGTTEDDDNAGANETDPNGGDFNLTTAGAITVRTPSIAAGSRFKAIFRVTVQ